MAHELAVKKRVAEKRQLDRTHDMAISLTHLRQPLPPSELQASISASNASFPGDPLRRAICKALRFIESSSIETHQTGHPGEKTSSKAQEGRDGLRKCLQELKLLVQNRKRAVWNVQAHLLLCWLSTSSAPDNDTTNFPLDDLDSIKLGTEALVSLLQGMDEPIITGLLLSIVSPSQLSLFLDFALATHNMAASPDGAAFTFAIFATTLLQTHNEIASSIVLDALRTSSALGKVSNLASWYLLHQTNGSVPLQKHKGKKSKKVLKSAPFKTPLSSLEKRISKSNPQQVEPELFKALVQTISQHAIEFGTTKMGFPAWQRLFEVVSTDHLGKYFTLHLPAFFKRPDALDSQKEALFGRLGDLVLRSTNQGWIKEAKQLLRRLLESFKELTTRRLVIARLFSGNHDLDVLFTAQNLEANFQTELVELFNKLTNEIDADHISSLLWLSFQHPAALAKKFAEQMAHTKGATESLTRYLAETPLPDILVPPSFNKGSDNSARPTPQSTRSSTTNKSVVTWALDAEIAAWQSSSASNQQNGSSESVARNLLATLRQLTQPRPPQPSSSSSSSSSTVSSRPLIAPLELVHHIILPKLRSTTAHLLKVDDSTNAIGSSLMQSTGFALRALVEIQEELNTTELSADSALRKTILEVAQLLLHIESFWALSRSVEGPTLTGLTSGILSAWNDIPSLHNQLTLPKHYIPSWNALSLVPHLIKRDSSSILEHGPRICRFFPKDVLRLLVVNQPPSRLTPTFVLNSILGASTSAHAASQLGEAFKTRMVETFRKCDLKKHLLLGSTQILPQLCARGFALCVHGLLAPVCEWQEFGCSWERFGGVGDAEVLNLFRAFHWLCDIVMALARDSGMIGASVYGKPILAENTRALWLQCLENTLAIYSDCLAALSLSSTGLATAPLPLMLLTFILVNRLWGPMVLLRSGETDPTWATIAQKPFLLVLDLFQRIQDMAAADVAELEACSKVREAIVVYGAQVRERTLEEVGVEMLMKYLPTVKCAEARVCRA